MLSKSDPVLQAAKDAFIERGYRATSMDDVARHAGTTKRTVYNNFKSKERLLEAVVQATIAKLKATVPVLAEAAEKRELTAYARRVFEISTWKGSIGMQRLFIAEGDSIPKLAELFLTSTSDAIERPIRLWLAARGHKDGDAKVAASRWIGELTAQARLDRLLGKTAPYPQEPGRNELTRPDDAAVILAIEALLKKQRPSSTKR
jgi:TetR/AcrR family transcriptional repressor of mexJK operon